MGFHQSLPPPSLIQLSLNLHTTISSLLKKPHFFHIPPKKQDRRRSKTTNFQQHTPLPTYIITNKHKEKEIKQKKNSKQNFNP